jgi:hypothetical protein
MFPGARKREDFVVEDRKKSWAKQREDEEQYGDGGNANGSGIDAYDGKRGRWMVNMVTRFNVKRKTMGWRSPSGEGDAGGSVRRSRAWLVSDKIYSLLRASIHRYPPQKSPVTKAEEAAT